MEAAILSDLRKSGLSDETIDRMRVRQTANIDLQYYPQANLIEHAYVLPYFIPDYDKDAYKVLEVDNAPYHRIRILSTHTDVELPKYLQKKGTGTHIYFPPIMAVRRWWDTKTPLVITEGEKKAAAACQNGFLCCGIAGVDAWRSRRIKIAPTAVEATSAENVTITLDEEDLYKVESRVAQELLWVPFEEREVYLCFDTDSSKRTQDTVQRTIFEFAIWLEEQGAKVTQVKLPPKKDGKNALDDYFLDASADSFKRLLKNSQFPIRPNIKSWISKQLQSPKAKGRKVTNNVSRAILSSLDAKGKRFKDPYGVYYFFDNTEDTLYSLPLETTQPLAVSAPDFHHKLVRDYGVTSVDRDVLTRLVEEFEAVDPIQEIPQVHKQSYAAPDAFYYQLSNSKMARVTSSDIEVMRNGTDGVLFEYGAKSVELINPSHIGQNFGWMQTVRSTSLEALPGMTLNDTHLFAACLFYLSPWMRRWRGLMLPSELAISEAGSGKSSLYQLRSSIFAGRARLGHSPESMRDWYASLGESRGLWVCDNIGTKIDARLSDEIARLITDPEPTIEMRQLYTTSRVERIPVDCVFAFTGIYNPFHKPDLLQRSIVLRFHSIKQKDGGWFQRHMANNGRAMWVTHQLLQIQKFLKHMEDEGITGWGISNSSRLIGFEQAMRCMGASLGKEKEIAKVLDRLSSTIQATITQSEPVLEALQKYSETMKTKKTTLPIDFTLQLFSDWCFQHSEFQDVKVVQNPRILSKYIDAHSADVKSSANIVKTTRDTLAGERIYSIVN